jgi:hypothetical protein
MSLAIIPAGDLPVARRALCDLNAKIERAERQVEVLQRGRRRLAEQLEIVDGARNELESLIAQDSFTLVDRIKNSVDWALSGFGGPRATKIAESLAASRLQNEIGQKAAVELDADTERLQTELDHLKARRPQLVAEAVREAAQGLFEDYDAALDELRALMVQLRGLEVFLGVERIPARTVATLPDFRFADGLPEQAIAAPVKEVAKATAVFADLARAIERDALVRIEDHLKFSPVNPGADDGFVLYHEMSEPERLRIDMRYSHG